MAADCTQEAILDFLKERGGKVKNTDLIEHFKAVFPEQPEKKAAARNRFKNYVDNVAFVKTDSGVKYVCLKKKFRGSVKETSRGTEPAELASGDPAAAAAPRGADRSQVGGGGGDAAAADPAQPRAAGGERVPPGSGYGNDSQLGATQLRVPVLQGATVTPSLWPPTRDDDRDSITLDPLEHEWMMCASDGEWSTLCSLLSTDPTLVLRKDFITGFTCLHWAAKQGKPELMALIINFAKQHNVPVSVDTRSNTGYTPLHIAAMHNHMEVVKLLVGAYNADVEIRDYSGKKACQYPH
ncbi:Ankyrin repeat domain-containing protein SOWAHC [Nibea albiflora]|uniref:Ankyrin repeat domain-containing protein SOWAHC n=1 Tax=Nibea albiflora TaxID=240163 RepID=A0ACB7ESQ5_NIBAL|nr:Ankyrin repeat domain-containing protein SOWAHC [Nibea albiflora]